MDFGLHGNLFFTFLSSLLIVCEICTTTSYHQKKENNAQLI